MIRILYLFLLLATQATALSAQTSIDEIRNALQKQQQLLPYEKAILEMKIVNDKGQERVRSMQSYQYTKDEAFKTVVIFDKPASVKGTGLLTVRQGENQTQKLYLPALKRIQTIGSSQKGDSFMGSDFTFEDLGQFDGSESDWKLVNETDKEWKIKATQLSESTFDSLLIRIDKIMTQPMEIRYYSKGEQVKQLNFNEYQEVKQGVWRASKLEMQNLKTNGKTVISWKERSFDEIPDSYFTERLLLRGR
jgi:hypothetical protein